MCGDYDEDLTYGDPKVLSLTYVALDLNRDFILVSDL